MELTDQTLEHAQANETATTTAAAASREPAAAVVALPPASLPAPLPLKRKKTDAAAIEALSPRAPQPVTSADLLDGPEELDEAGSASASVLRVSAPLAPVLRGEGRVRGDPEGCSAAPSEQAPSIEAEAADTDAAVSHASLDDEETPVTTPPHASSGHHGWTIVMLAAGFAIIACCLLIPQADENRKLLYQCEKLQIDLDHLQKQVEVNQEFVNRVGKDPVLAERLAQRQLKHIRRGASVLKLKDEAAMEDQSPFSLVTLPPPPPTPEYKPVGGKIASLCSDRENRLRLIGGGLVLLAAGLVLGHAGQKS